MSNIASQSQPTATKSIRQHYLDWLQVLAIFGVFLFHTISPFNDLFGWHIKNAEPSALANFFIGFFVQWGMAFFFLMAGATSWFSLRRRTTSRYARERVTRLLIPYIVGAIVLTPIQAFYELMHKGWWKGDSIVEFIFSTEARNYFYTEFHPIVISPGVFGRVGYHLWFVAFLFAFSLIALPLFLWLKQDAGKRFIAPFARLAQRRGGLLVFIIPLVLVRYVVQPGMYAEHDWVDFIYNLLFFVFGYILIADDRFMRAIRRDWLLHLILGIGCTMFFFSSAFGVPVADWMGSPGTSGFYASWTLFGFNSWCWTMVMFYAGMRFLDFSNERLLYGREASYPFFWIHQPVIIFIAFYVVQWEVDLLIKLLVVVIGSFVVVLGLYELLIRRINPIRVFFGMKPKTKAVSTSSTA